MEINVTNTKIQSKEFYEIDAMLTTLWKEGLLTDTDCRIIACSNTLVEKKAAVYTAIMSKTKEDAANLTETFRKMTLENDAKENLTSSFDAITEEENNSVTPPRNPFLNNMIIKNLFGFLPLEDMKRSRLVCREWNSTGEICLRKRSAIHFRPKLLLPYTFMELSKHSHPNLPFSSFLWSSDENSSWHISDIQDFFNRWGKNIKEVTFYNVRLASNLMGQEFSIMNYDITPMFTIPSNITSLTLINSSGRDDPSTKWDISLENFASIKYLFIAGCRIIYSANNERARVAPHSVNLQGISVIENGEIKTPYYYHELVDFSKALNINLQEGSDEDILEMESQVFNANQLHLSSVFVQNWGLAKGNVEFLRLLDAPFVEKNHFKIKILSFGDSKIDLNALPETLEVLHLAEGDFIEIVCSAPLNLPKLKFLFIDVKDTDSLAYFSNCENLVDLAIVTDNSIYEARSLWFNVTCIPKSVKRITMELLQMEFIDYCIFEVDTLILIRRDGDLGLPECSAITARIKAKVLIVDFGPGIDIDSTDIFQLLHINKQSQKIIIGSDSDLHQATPFEGSYFSECVDKKSNYYEFVNNVGKSITSEEFKRHRLSDYIPEYFHYKRLQSLLNISNVACA